MSSIKAITKKDYFEIVTRIDQFRWRKIGLFQKTSVRSKFVRFWFFFLFSDRFYDGNKYLTAYNHLSHESYWFWSLLNFHDFRHYIYYSIYTKCQIGKAKPSPRTERFSVLESLGPMEWETGVTAIDFKLFLFCATLKHVLAAATLASLALLRN